MANILEFLRGVLTEPDGQAAFRADPAAYVDTAGFVDLTGEDVVEAVLVLRRSLPDDLAGRLGAFEDDDVLPPPRPVSGETELDAAVRMLSFAIDEAAGTTGAAAADQEIIETTEAPIAVEVDPDLAEAEPPAGDAAAAPPAGDGFGWFSDAIDTLAVEATAAIEAAAEAAREAGRMAIAAAEADADELRTQARQEREAAAAASERVRTEVDELLQRARDHSEESRRRAEELVAGAEAEAAATRAELAARRQELREVERQIKDRMAGIDSLLRTALHDDEP